MSQNLARLPPCELFMLTRLSSRVLGWTEVFFATDTQKDKIYKNCNRRNSVCVRPSRHQQGWEIPCCPWIERRRSQEVAQLLLSRISQQNLPQEARLGDVSGLEQNQYTVRIQRDWPRWVLLHLPSWSCVVHEHFTGMGVGFRWMRRGSGCGSVWCGQGDSVLQT